MLGGLIMYPTVANFLQYVSAKNDKDLLTFVDIVAEHKVGTFLEKPCHLSLFNQLDFCVHYWSGRVVQ